MNFAAEMTSGMLAAGSAGAMALDHGLFRRVADRLDCSIYRGSKERRTVALTFDDGPGPQTLELLELLQEHGVLATFFQCGQQVERYPEIAKQVLVAGHELGNHTWSHPRLDLRPRRDWEFPGFARMRRELAATQQILREVTGATPTVFRPPYGARWLGLDAVCRQLDLRCVQWTVIGHDWEWAAERIVPHIVRKVVPGAIVCLHDGRDVQPTADIQETLRSVDRLIPLLREQGYRFETVSALLAGGSSRANAGQVS